MKDKKNIFIGVLIFAIVVMSIGYAAFATTLNINGSAKIVGSWNVEITGITPVVTGTASEDPASSFTPTTATFSAKLLKPGDSITYTVNIENNGTIDARLNSITLTPQTSKAEGGTGSDAILYEIVSKPADSSVLAAGEDTTVVVKVTYDPDSSEIPAETTRTFTGVIEYVQAD